MSLHLLNRSNLPLPDRYNFTDYIPAAGPITVRMKLGAKPKKVTLVPDGGKIKWTWKNGWLAATIPQVHIHGGRGPGLCPGVHFRRTRPWIQATGEWRAEGSSLDSALVVD